MDQRTAHALREAHAAHNSFAAEGGHVEMAAKRHKAAMENMARNVRQDRHLPGHEHLIPEVREWFKQSRLAVEDLATGILSGKKRLLGNDGSFFGDTMDVR